MGVLFSIEGRNRQLFHCKINFLLIRTRTKAHFEFFRLNTGAPLESTLEYFPYIRLRKIKKKWFRRIGQNCFDDLRENYLGTPSRQAGLLTIKKKNAWVPTTNEGKKPSALSRAHSYIGCKTPIKRSWTSNILTSLLHERQLVSHLEFFFCYENYACLLKLHYQRTGSPKRHLMWKNVQTWHITNNYHFLILSHAFAYNYKFYTAT